MRWPRITVITPSFRQGHFIEATIRSVVEQSYPDIEFIVIDGGSEDGTIEVLRKYEHKITTWVSEKDSGQSAAINKGLKLATGDIITWLSSDDVYLPGALQKAATAFTNHPEAGLIHGSAELFGDGRRSKIIGNQLTNLPYRYFAGIPFPQPSSFFSRFALERGGLLDESLHFGMDYDLLLRIALQFPIVQIDELLSGYRLHPFSKTGSSQTGFAADWQKVFSRFVGFATYQLDSNLRNSTMVGIVGAGGIGGTLFSAFQRFDYDFVCAILLSIIGMIMAGEVLAQWVRGVFLERGRGTAE